MTIFKKFLCLLLCFGVVLTISVGTVFADDTEAENMQNADIEFMKALGIFPADFMSGQALTRNDLAQIYFRIVMPHLADVEYIEIEKKFSDLGDEDFAAAFISDMGIMNGVSTTEFNPDGTLTYSQIIKTLVTFLGYDEMAKDFGGYPGGYMVCGNKFGLNAVNAPTEDAVVTTDAAATLFRLALNINIADVKYCNDGSVTLHEGKENYIEHYMNVYTAEGVVTANYLSDLYHTKGATSFHDIKIDDRIFTLSNSVLGLNELLGYRVKVYARQVNEGDTPEILYYELCDTEVYVVDSKEIEKYDADSGKFTYFDKNNKKRSYDISDAFVLYNNELCENFDADTLNPFDTNLTDGSVRLIDNDGDKKIDVVLIEAYSSYVVKKIVDGKIYNVYRPSVIFDISDLEDGQVAVRNVIGNIIPLSEITEDDIISVFADSAGNIKQIIVTVDTYTGNVKEILQSSTNLVRVNIDGTYFECSNMISNSVVNEKSIRVGKDIKVFFDFNRRICNIETENLSEEKLGYLIRAKKFNPLTDTVDIKILTAMDTFLITKLKSNIYINGIKMTCEEALVALGMTDGAEEVTRQPIKYVYDKEKDEITEIKTVDDTIDETSDGFYRYKRITDDMKSYFRTSTGSFNAKLILGGSTVVFIVPEDATNYDDDTYRADGVSYFPDGSNSVMFEAYGSKAYNPVAEILVIESDTPKKYTSSAYLVVDTVSEILSDDGEHKYCITGFENGKPVSRYIDETVLYIAPDGQAPAIGDVIKVGYDKNKNIIKTWFIFDESTRIMDSSFGMNPTASSAFADDRYLYGSVKYFDDSVVTVSMFDYGAGAVEQLESYTVTGLTVYEVNSKGRIPSVTVSNSNILHDEHHNNYPSNVFIYTDNIVPKFMVIYTD